MNGLRLTLIVLLSGYVTACATQVTLVPPLPESPQPAGSLAVRLEYEGRTEFLPRALRPDPAAALTARYAIDAALDRDDFPELFVLYNPLTLFGFPTGATLANASGTLEITGGDGVVRRYQAQAVARKRNNLYSGDSLTEIRRSALLAIRDSLDSQLLEDLGALSSAPSDTTSNVAPGDVTAKGN